jgi:hypothetical protein
MLAFTINAELTSISIDSLLGGLNEFLQSLKRGEHSVVVGYPLLAVVGQRPDQLNGLGLQSLISQ